MRNIKFRVFDKIENKMLSLQDIIITFDNLGLQIHKKDGSPLRNCNIMQCTELEDEDGKKIYEGDILKFQFQEEEYIGEVCFEIGNFIVVNDRLLKNYISLVEITEYDGDQWINGKIIGNIYEKI